MRLVSAWCVKILLPRRTFRFGDSSRRSTCSILFFSGSRPAQPFVTGSLRRNFSPSSPIFQWLPCSRARCALWTIWRQNQSRFERSRRNGMPTFVVREGYPLRSSRFSRCRCSLSLAGRDSQPSPPGCVVAVSRTLRQSQARHQSHRSERAGAGGRECFATPICWRGSDAQCMRQQCGHSMLSNRIVFRCSDRH